MNKIKIITLCDPMKFIVIDVNEYIGESTKKEIEYTKNNGEKVRFFLKN